MKIQQPDSEISSKILEIVANNGNKGILQAELYRELEIPSKVGSKIMALLQSKELLRCIKVQQDGQWTYKYIAFNTSSRTDTIEQAPCLSCPVEHMCSSDSNYSPQNCNYIEDWIMLSFGTESKAHVAPDDYKGSKVDGETMAMHKRIKSKKKNNKNKTSANDKKLLIRPRSKLTRRPKKK